MEANARNVESLVFAPPAFLLQKLPLMYNCVLISEHFSNYTAKQPIVLSREPYGLRNAAKLVPGPGSTRFSLLGKKEVF